MWPKARYKTLACQQRSVNLASRSSPKLWLEHSQGRFWCDALAPVQVDLERRCGNTLQDFHAETCGIQVVMSTILEPGYDFSIQITQAFPQLLNKLSMIHVALLHCIFVYIYFIGAVCNPGSLAGQRLAVIILAALETELRKRRKKFLYSLAPPWPTQIIRSNANSSCNAEHVIAHSESPLQAF